MKKVSLFWTAVVLCFTLMFSLTVSAANASATLTGPGTVRAGDTITLSFNLGGSNILGASGTLVYDSSQVTLVKTAQAMRQTPPRQGRAKLKNQSPPEAKLI